MDQSYVHIYPYALNLHATVSCSKFALYLLIHLWLKILGEILTSVKTSHGLHVPMVTKHTVLCPCFTAISLSLSLSDHLSLSLSLLFLLQWRIRPLHPTTSRPRRSQHKPHPLRQGYHARRPHLLVIGVPSPRRVQSPSPLSTICTQSLQSILTFDHAPSFPCLATTGCSLLRWTLCHWYEVRLFCVAEIVVHVHVS